MTKKRVDRALQNTILVAAGEGRGLRLSAAEVRLLAKQPFIMLDPRLMELEWRKIPHYDRYEVSEEGHVRRGYYLLKQTETRDHHCMVTVYSATGRQWRAGVHTLVAIAFHGPAPIGKPFACHENGRAWENQKGNIYWGSREDNTADMKRHASLKRGGESVELKKALSIKLGESNA